jgi:hypothetical protein
MEPARLVVRAGLDQSLYPDGSSLLFGLDQSAISTTQGCNGSVFCATGIEFYLVISIFSDAPAWVGFRGNHPAMALYPAYHFRIRAAEPPRCLAIGTVY